MQWHVPVDDENCYWYAIFTSYSTPVDKKKMRDQRLNSTSCRITSRARTSRRRLRLRCAGAGDRDLYPHGEHQRARPVGGRWARSGPLQRTSRQRRQGHRAVPPPAAAGNREGKFRAKLLHVPRRRACKDVQGPATMDGIGPTRGWEAFWMEVDVKLAAAARHRPRPVPAEESPNKSRRSSDDAPQAY